MFSAKIISLYTGNVIKEYLDVVEDDMIPFDEYLNKRIENIRCLILADGTRVELPMSGCILEFSSDRVKLIEALREKDTIK